MTRSIQTLVAVDGVSDRYNLEALMLNVPGVELVGFVDANYGEWAGAQADSDVIVVACGGGGSEAALAWVDTAVRERPDRPVVVLTDGAANGFVQRAFDAGADDLVTLLPGFEEHAAAEQVAFALQKAVARRTGASHAAA